MHPHSSAACHPRHDHLCSRSVAPTQNCVLAQPLRAGRCAQPRPSSSRHRSLHRQQQPHNSTPAALPSRRALIGVAAGVGGSGALIAGGLVAAGAAAAAAASGMLGGGSDNPQALVRTGMQRFRQNEVKASVADFDRALALSPQLRPFLWQRGLSLYYLGQFQEAAQQFRDDVAVNPNDTEESIWCFLCEAQLQGPDQARDTMLRVGRDPRPVMRAAYECFRSGASPSAILAAAGSDTSGHDAFYALLYVGLWHEAHSQPQQAQDAMARAVATQYAQRSGDYMASLARVHCQQRGWALPSA